MTRVRQQLIDCCVRLLHEQQAQDIPHAYGKACDKLGLSRHRLRLDQPLTHAIAHALQQYQQLFTPHDAQATLLANRQAIAQEALECFGDFSPRLVDREWQAIIAQQPMTLVLYGEVESVHHSLLEWRLPFDLAETRWPRSAEITNPRWPGFRLLVDEVTLQLIVLPLAKQHQRHWQDRQGQPICLVGGKDLFA